MGEMPCSLHHVRVRAEVGRVVPLRLPGSLDIAGVLRHGHGNRSGIFTDNGWMLIILPDTDGFLGLPLEGERNSWHAAWENENIQFELCTETGWMDIEEIGGWQRMRCAVAR